MIPQALQNLVSRFDRVDAEFRCAEIRRASRKRDVGDEEADLRGIDIKYRRLDIDRKIGPRHLTRLDRGGKILYAGAHACAGLTAFLVPDEPEHDFAFERQLRPVDDAQCHDGRAQASLEVGRATAPNFALDDGRAEGAFPFGPPPFLAPATHMNRIGVSDKQNARARFRTLAPAPDIGAPRQKLSPDDLVDAGLF